MALQNHAAAASVGSLVWGSTQVQTRAAATSRSRRSHIRPAQHHQRQLSNMNLRPATFFCFVSSRHLFTALVNVTPQNG